MNIGSNPNASALSLINHLTAIADAREATALASGIQTVKAAVRELPGDFNQRCTTFPFWCKATS